MVDVYGAELSSQALDPVFINAPALGDGINVIGQRQGHNVGFNTIDDRRCLASRIRRETGAR